MREGGVSVAYHTAISKGKRAERLRPVRFHGLRYVQFPFLLLRRSFWALVLTFNWWDIIDEQVLLGEALMFDDLERLRQLGVKAVVNLCAERPDNPYRLDRAQMDYLWLPVTDTYAPTGDQILQGLAWLEQRVTTGPKAQVKWARG